LAPEARRRLEALQRYNELGAGFHVASRDLEIRGAGDLLGRKQSGHIQAVGFDTYARILAEAAAELRGQPLANAQTTELVFDVPAFLPDDWIDDVGQRLDAYRRLAAADTPDRLRDLLAELDDRYGALPVEARHYGGLLLCRLRAQQLGASSLELRLRKVTLRLDDATWRRVAALPAEARDLLTVSSGGRVVIELPGRIGEDASRVLEVLEDRLTRLVAVVAAGRTPPVVTQADARPGHRRRG